MAEQINIDVKVSGEVELGKVSKQVENLGKNTNKTSNYMTDLRKQLRDAKAAMLQAEEGSQAYNNALAKVAKISFELKDSQEKSRLAIMDLGAVSQNVGRAMGGLAGGIQTAAGAMALFGAESDASLQVIQKLTGLIAITQGIVGFADTIDNLRDLFIGLKASSSASKGSIDEFNQTIQQTVQTSSNAATNMVGMTSVSDNMTKATQNLTSTMAEQNITAIDQIRWMKEYSNAAGKSLTDIRADVNERQKMSKAWKQYKEDMAAAKAATEELNAANNTLAQTSQKAGSGMVSMGKNILKSFGWTALIIAALTAIMWAVTKLIEKMNEIPKDVEINLKINEESTKKLQDNIEKARLFALDYYRAVQTKDAERVKELENYAQKEFNIHKDRLKAIGQNVNAWRDAFSKYLQIAKDTYYNEALAKQKTEVELGRTIAKQKIEDIKAAMYREYGSTKTENITQGRVVALWGLGKMYKEAVETYNDLNEQVKTLNKIKFRPIDMGIGKVEPTKPTTSTKPTTVKIKPQIEKTTYTDIFAKIQEDINKMKPKMSLPGFNIPKGELLGTTPEYYQKQLDDAQYSYDMGITSYEDFLNTKNHILQNAESMGIKMTETSFQTQLTIAEYNYQKLTSQVQAYQDMMSSVADITDAFVSMYDTKMKTIDNYYNAEKALIEQSTLSEEEKNKQLYALDQERYKKQKEVFEQSKAFQIASVYIGLASGLMGTFVRASDPLNPLKGPASWIAAGLEAAALIAQSIASVQAINSQTLEAPTPPSAAGGSAGVGSAQNISISPTKSTMTSSVENLNKMISSQTESTSVVKVSEINDVQKTVKVRETNQTY